MSIPLTFDWVTLTFLKTRFHLWWRGGRVSPRQLALLLLLGVLSSCVPATRFEESQSAAQVEMGGRQRAEYQLQQLKAENQQLRDQMQQQGRSLNERDESLSQAALDSSTQGKQREDAEGMVQQLRGELARVGGHLQAYHDDNQQLTASLDAQGAHGRALARLSRDVALTLPEPLATGEYTLDAEQSGVVLRLPRDKVLGDGGSVKPEAEPLLKAVSRLMQLHPESKLRVEDSAARADAIAVAQLVTALTQHQIAAERFQPLAVDAALNPAPAPPALAPTAAAPAVEPGTAPVVAAPPAAPAVASEIVLSFSVP